MALGAKIILVAAGLVLRLPSSPSPAAAPRVEGPQAGAPLAAEIRALDRRLFDLAFEKEGAAMLRALLTDDFTFQDDRQGLVAASPEAFIALVHRQFEDRAKGAASGARREALPGDEAVYPLARHGAIHTGRHGFFGPASGRMTETACFFHVWRRSQGGWRLAQAYSYDHQPADTAPR